MRIYLLIGQEIRILCRPLEQPPGCISKKCKGFPQGQGKLSRTVRNNEVSVSSECPQSGVRVYFIMPLFI